MIPGAFYAKVKEPGLEAGDLVVRSPEFNEWNFISMTLYTFIAWCLGTGTTLLL
jgi:hypothetical protein